MLLYEQTLQRAQAFHSVTYNRFKAHPTSELSSDLSSGTAVLHLKVCPRAHIIDVVTRNPPGGTSTAARNGARSVSTERHDRREHAHTRTSHHKQDTKASEHQSATTRGSTATRHHTTRTLSYSSARDKRATATVRQSRRRHVVEHEVEGGTWIKRSEKTNKSANCEHPNIRTSILQPPTNLHKLPTSAAHSQLPHSLRPPAVDFIETALESCHTFHTFHSPSHFSNVPLHSHKTTASAQWDNFGIGNGAANSQFSAALSEEQENTWLSLVAMLHNKAL